MYIKLIIENVSGDNMNLPYSYEETLQGFVYSLTDEQFGDFLHNVGYIYNNRNYKLFCFSNIIEKPLKLIRNRHRFIFPPRITIIISTVENEMMQSLFNIIYDENREYALGKYRIKIVGIEMMETPYSSDILVKTLSPICVNSTLFKADHSKWTQYHRPDDKDFGRIIRENAIKKYAAYNKKLPDDSTLSVIPISHIREVKSSYKKFSIRSYHGRFRLQGSPELIHILMETGMGSRNAEGRGLIFPVMDMEGDD